RSAEAQATLARAWQAQRLTDRATDAATAAVRLAPEDASHRLLLASLLEQQGKTAEAVEQYLAARERRPRDAQLLESLAGAYARLGRGADSVTTLEAALALRPDDPALLARLGRAYLAINQPVPAARVLTRSVATASQPAQTYADLGLARLGNGDAAGATAALEHAVALDPAHAGAAPANSSLRGGFHGTDQPLSFLRFDGRDRRPRGTLPRGLRHRARAPDPHGARRHLRHALRGAAAHDAAGWRAQDHGRGGRAALPRPLRAGAAGRPADRRLGQGCRARPLADASPAPHEQSPTHADGEDLVDGVARSWRWRRS